MARPTPKTVNAALKAAGFNVRIVRNVYGGSYYYFIDDGFDVVPSIYAYSLEGFTMERIVEHVRSHLKNPD
jgi:hypothetical protein